MKCQTGSERINLLLGCFSFKITLPNVCLMLFTVHRGQWKIVLSRILLLIFRAKRFYYFNLPQRPCKKPYDDSTSIFLDQSLPWHATPYKFRNVKTKFQNLDTLVVTDVWKIQNSLNNTKQKRNAAAQKNLLISSPKSRNLGFWRSPRMPAWGWRPFSFQNLCYRNICNIRVLTTPKLVRMSSSFSSLTPYKFGFRSLMARGGMWRI